MANKGITYYWGDNDLIITLGNTTHQRIKALYVIEFLFTATMATIFLMQSLPFRHSFLHWMACIAAASLYLLAAYRFLARLFFTEKLILEPHALTIVKKALFLGQSRKYAWRDIGSLHYEGHGTKTDHPLKGKCFDYFGFETQEQLIQTLHHDGNLYFDTPDGRVYFASGVYSWNAEEMVQMMRMYMGTSLKLGPEWKQLLQEQEFDDFA